MKSVLLTLTITFLTAVSVFAQRPVSGTVVDSTKATLPGSSIRLVTNLGDSTGTIADANGKFSFPAVRGNSITLTITSIGYQGLKRTYKLGDDTKPVELGQIILAAQSRTLNAVTIVGVNPVVLKQDTVQYDMNAYKVRENAPLEDALKKMPGVDVDKDGNVTTQGKSVTKVRVNGKDFMGGDLKTATRNLPADLIQSVQVVDDYGDQANLTGVKTGEPEKILNIVIRPDRNKGYFGQGTVGEGYDGLPKPQNNDNRYLALINAFVFNNNQQFAVLGNLNNTNVNTFSFNSGGGAGGGGMRMGGGGNFGGGGGGFGGGGRGNAIRGGSSGQTNNASGINTSRSIGTNYRDQWGKYITVYGSYSLADITTNVNSIEFQQNNSPGRVTVQNQNSFTETGNTNHRLNFNLEYKPDTINYFKFTPSLSYSKTNTIANEISDLSRDGAPSLAYASQTTQNSSSPNLSANALYNHRFNANGRNLSINVNAGTTKNEDFQNPIYQYTVGTPTSPPFQLITTNSRTNSFGVNMSYLEPIGLRNYLELNYAYNHSLTKSDKETLAGTNENNAVFDPTLSNNYNYTFTTHRVGLNYRFIEKKYNYTLGLGLQPTTLDGSTPGRPEFSPVKKTSLNIIPTARFVYNFSRSQSLNFNYNGGSNQPSFNQLQPVLDRSNALYPVQGNPNLEPEFNNSISLRYNKFSFETGNVFFTNLSFNQTSNKIVTNVITYPSSYAPDPTLANTLLTEYLNASGYYQASGFVVYSKPWAQRKYTLFLNGNVTYNNNVGYISALNYDAATNASSRTTQKNIGRNWVYTPGARFRVDLTNIIDAEVGANYAINKTSNSLKESVYNQNNNLRTLNLSISGKNYFFKDWTLSYDFTRAINYGYTVPITNPNILNAYVERRFLKQNMATIRLQGFDLFNQNTGYSATSTANSISQSNTNRLGRYFLLSFTMRLQKFAGRAPNQGGDGQRMRMRDGGGPGGNGPGGPGSF